MNKIMNDILLLLFKSNNNTNQRKISKQLNVSLGLVNKCINNLIKENLLLHAYYVPKTVSYAVGIWNISQMLLRIE